jgi:hypothetical protein
MIAFRGEVIMNEGKKIIFVSCGQRTQQEQDLGQGVEDLVNRTPGFCAYRAASVQDLQGLNENIMAALRGCSGLVAVLHTRGKMNLGNNRDAETSSIWINQEIAILSYRRWFENTPIPVRIFKEPEVALEGAMTSQIANPTDFASDDQVLEEVEQWLGSASFVLPLDQAEFTRLVAQLDDGDWKVIEAVVAARGLAVTKRQLKQYLRAKGVDKAKATDIVNSACHKFAGINNLVLHQRYGPGTVTLTLNPRWEWELRRELGKKGAEVAEKQP